MDGHIRLKKKRQSTSERLGVALVVLVILGGAGGVAWWLREGGKAPPADSNRSAVVADIVPLVDLLPDGDHGWVGQITPGWYGANDRGALDKACARVLDRLGARPDQTFTLLGEDGGPAAECGAGIEGPRVDPPPPGAPAVPPVLGPGGAPSPLPTP